MTSETIRLMLEDGLRLHRAGRLKEAAALYERILAVSPDDADATHGLGLALHGLGDHVKAAALIRRSIELRPGVPQFHSNLAAVLGAAGDWPGAVVELKVAVAIDPTSAAVHTNLGTGLERAGRPGEALAAYADAILRLPGYAPAHHGRGRALRYLGRVDEAVDALRKTVRLEPERAAAWRDLAVALEDEGDAAEVIAARRRVLELCPSSAADHSALLYAMHYEPALGPDELSREHRRWADRHAARLRPAIVPHTNDRDPERRLRIGYVSPDLREQTVTRFLLPILKNRDSAKFEVFCYSDGGHCDRVTDRLRTLSDGWSEVSGLSDGQAASLIRNDQIDILVDLRGHGTGNRLTLFARKPAPVQVSYIGYFGTTGLTAMDYRVTDEVQDPSGLTDHLYTEGLMRLGRCSWCYGPDPLDEHPLLPEPPSVASGVVTFGSLNKVVKASPVAVALWAKILEAVPNSRMLIAVLGGERTALARRRLEQLGMPPGRLTLVDKSRTTGGYFDRFNEIDVSLDPTPFCGITTTCDSLWMGVPVVTLAGSAPLSRVGASLLTGAGFPEWIATTPEEYVRIAAALAANTERRRALRRGLREHLMRSPLCDGVGLACAFETGLRDAWGRWCRLTPQAP